MSSELTNAEHYWRGNISRIRIATEKLQASIDAKKKAECFELIQTIEGSLAASARRSGRTWMVPRTKF